MLKQKKHKMIQWLFFTCSCLFLFACTGQDSAANNEDETEEEPALHLVNIEPELFQKVAGWFGPETVLLHTGDMDQHELHLYNVVTGEIEELYEEKGYILSIELNPLSSEILFQIVTEEGVFLKIINSSGEISHSIPIDYNGYVSLDWNSVNTDLIFIAHYHYSLEEEGEDILVQIWDIESNTLTERPVSSMYPKWYTSNVYVYIDELEGRNLYIGDIREDSDDLIINRDVVDFFMNQDTFIGVVESDINDTQVYLFHEYPFLVGESVITIPKITMNDVALKPHLTQSNRDGEIYGVIPQQAVALEESLGDFNLEHLDFSEQTTEEIVSLPYDAPIELSPNEEFILFGWRFEYIIDLQTHEMHSLLESM
ncbi:MAG: hypothetical protein JJU01_02175 [Alkalibacterium sp.]|nr:hypothetical protein [Alkalibacterium sp.]